MSDRDDEDKENPRPHLPALRQSEPHDDPTDAKFSDAEFIELPKTIDPYRPSPFYNVAKAATYGWLVLGVLYLVFGRGSSAVTVPPPPQPIISGWNDLAQCTFLTSLDETRELTLTEKQGAEFREGAPSQGTEKAEGRFIEGVWNYDAGSKRYLITLDGETTSYALLSRGDPTTCILVKGDLGTADLRASWFSFPSKDDVPDYDYEPDRR
jgi:hypothetical protein